MLIKLRFRSPEIFLGALLVIVVFAMGMVFESSRYGPTKEYAERNGTKENQPKPERGGFWNWLTHDATGFFTLGLIIVGGIQIGVFLGQLRLIRKSLGPAEQAAKAAQDAAIAANLNAVAVMRAERAYVWPGFATCTTRTGEGGAIVGIIWHISLHNTGRTAAIIKTVHHALMTEEDFNLGLVSHIEFRGRENVVPPNRPGTETHSGVDQLVTGEPKISCGYIVYTDVFGQTHKQGWKHRLWHDRPQSDSLPGCYSDTVDA